MTIPVLEGVTARTVTTEPADHPGAVCRPR